MHGICKTAWAEIDKSGALRALAITAEKRWFDLPDMPTAEEQGIPGLVPETFQGLYAPFGTPAAIVGRVARDTLDVLNDPATIDKLRGIGFDVAGKRAGRPRRPRRQGSADVARHHRPVAHRIAVDLLLPSVFAGEENELARCSPVEFRRAFRLTVSLPFPKLATDPEDETCRRANRPTTSS